MNFTVDSLIEALLEEKEKGRGHYLVCVWERDNGHVTTDRLIPFTNDPVAQANGTPMGKIPLLRLE